MKYPDLKSAIAQMTQEAKKKGASQEQAEQRILKAMTAMFKDQQLGAVDLMLIFRILGYEFPNDLADIMEKTKEHFRKEYGLDATVEDLWKKGFTEHQAIIATIRAFYDSFKEGTIEEPESLDGVVLWPLGYRLTEKFYKDYYAGKNPDLDYEEDE